MEHKHTHSHAPGYANVKVTTLPHSEVEIEGEIVVAEMQAAYKETLKKFVKNADLPGFRKGNVPEAVVVQKVGEMSILEEAAETALSHHYGHIIMDHKIEVIGRPQITLTKIAKDNPLGFKIRVAIFPTFTLPEYKKIASEVTKTAAKENTAEALTATEKEVTEMLEQIRKDQNRGKKPEELPPLDDAFAKSLGGDFTTLEQLRTRIAKHVSDDKALRAKEKVRITIGEKMVAATKIDLPNILVESEIEKMKRQFEGDLKKMGADFQGYLKHAKKTEDDVRKDWRKDAESRVTLQILLNGISTKESIAPTDEEITHETAHILEHTPDADPEAVKNYVESMITNEKVFQFLESGGVKKSGEKKEA